MNRKKIMASVLAASMALSMSAAAFALDAIYGEVTDGDGDPITFASGGTKDFTMGDETGAGMFDTIAPDQTFYIGLGEYGNKTDTVDLNGVPIPRVYFGDSDYFSISTKDKSGDASKLIKITQEDSKSIDKYGRGSWLKVVVGDSMTSDEMKGTMTLQFSPKSKLYEQMAKDVSSYTDSNGDTYTDEDEIEAAVKADIDGEKYKIDLTFWVNNEIEDGSDTDRDTGDAFVFDPSSNEENTIIWNTSDGERAALKFDADDDADKFYAKLSTKSISSLWSEYADPIGADLWFYDFVGATAIPATSRATLTLGVPWDDDDDYAPAPEDCFIYKLGADGELTDVTGSFTYDEDGDIDGWYTRTRELGTYVVSDMELDIDVAGAEVDEDEAVDDAGDTTTTDKEIPNTGSGDAVNLAVVAAVVSLSAAGAAAFRKASK